MKSISDLNVFMNEQRQFFKTIHKFSSSKADKTEMDKLYDKYALLNILEFGRR